MIILLGTIVGYNISSSLKHADNVVQNFITPKDFYNAGYIDTGEGIFYIVTSNGISKNENIPKMPVKKNNSTIEIEYCIEGMQTMQCILYVDGMKKHELVSGNEIRNSLILSSENLTPGIHTVEIVAIENKIVIAYKIAQYEIEGE